MPWILDVLDALASHPSPDQGARQALVTTIATSTYEFATDLPPDERMLLQTIAGECHAAVVLPPVESKAADTGHGLWSQLDGKFVGVYSLLPGIGSHLRDRLALVCDDVEVEQNSDKSASSALRTLAGNADYLIVDTKHASHAATAAIDSERPRDRQLFPTGGGVSSFIARLREELERQWASLAPTG